MRYVQTVLTDLKNGEAEVIERTMSGSDIQSTLYLLNKRYKKLYTVEGDGEVIIAYSSEDIKIELKISSEDM
jgi:hypothetical protein